VLTTHGCQAPRQIARIKFFYYRTAARGSNSRGTVTLIKRANLRLIDLIAIAMRTPGIGYPAEAVRAAERN
jgi:hypothetical protein